MRLLGQILPGCSVVQTPAEHKHPQIPVVIFPGNVGQVDWLSRALELLLGQQALWAQSPMCP